MWRCNELSSFLSVLWPWGLAHLPAWLLRNNVFNDSFMIERQTQKRNKARGLDRITKVLASSNIQRDPEMLIASVRRIASVTINFHPDRWGVECRSVAAALYDDGIYRSQFESKISNGGLTAFPGGDRDKWEAALFGGCSGYQFHPQWL